MNLPIPQINLVLAWLWILLGFVSGMVLGMFFHGEHWLGGYASFKRRMYRLGHISFFGLGVVNLLFFFTIKNLPVAGPLVAAASWALVVGAVTMPVCSVLMAHFPKAHLTFAVPVLSLIAGGVLTLTLVLCSKPSTLSGKPTPNPSQGGEQNLAQRETVPLLGGVRGGVTPSESLLWKLHQSIPSKP